MTSEVSRTYLQDMEGHLACFAEARQLAAEFAAHLDDCVTRLEASGLLGDAAVLEAIARLGTPSDIARAFAAEGEPLAVPTRFTRLSGWLAMLSLPCWLITFGFMFASERAETTRDWEGLPQTLWLLGTLTMAVAEIGLVVVAAGLHRREGGLGPTAKCGIAVLGLSVVVTPMAWFVPGWTTLTAAGLGVLALELRSRDSSFGGYTAVAAAGAAAALLSFCMVMVLGKGNLWSIPFGVMLITAVAVTAIGARLVGEPEVAVPVGAGSNRIA